MCSNSTQFKITIPNLYSHLVSWCLAGKPESERMIDLVSQRNYISLLLRNNANNANMLVKVRETIDSVIQRAVAEIKDSNTHKQIVSMAEEIFDFAAQTLVQMGFTIIKKGTDCLYLGVPICDEDLFMLNKELDRHYSVFFIRCE